MNKKNSGTIECTSPKSEQEKKLGESRWARLQTSMVRHNTSLDGQPRLWFACANVQVDLVLCLAYKSLKTFTYVSAQTFRCSGPSCSKLTMSLVNDSLKFISSDMQIC